MPNRIQALMKKRLGNGRWTNMLYKWKKLQRHFRE